MNDLIGATAQFNRIIEETDLATNWQNDIPCLATPILLWLSELACMEVLGKTSINQDEMTVGYAHQSKHIGIGVLGEKLVLDAKLKSIDGKKLIFSVEGFIEENKVFEGIHERYIVNKASLLEKIYSRIVKE